MFKAKSSSLRNLVVLTWLGLAITGTAVAQVPDTVTALPEMVYAKVDGVELHAFIAYPKNFTGLLPAIINIHGGGWIGGKPDQGSAVWMAREGYFCASVEYRLSNVAKWPAQLEDCKLAVRWLRAHAAEYHVDPNRIGVFGASAGGHLSACVATMADMRQYDVGEYPTVSSAVQALGDFFGPTDFTLPEHYSPMAIHLTEGLMGMPYEKDPEAWKNASPVFHVKAGDPPTIIVQGAADGLVPPAQSTDFADALAKAGVEHQLIMVKNGDHGFKPNPPGSIIDPSHAEIDKAVFAFFDKHLKTP